MKILLDSCIWKGAKEVLERYEQELQNNAIITVDKFRVRIRSNY